jgi:hypothetical protein
VKNSLLALAISAALGMSTTAFAQTTQLKVAVPFDFMAGDTVLPAGHYDVQSTDTWGGKALSIHNVTSNAGTLILSDSCQTAKTSDSSKLVFYRYGDRYFLAEVWTANTNIGRKMPLNQRQKELARNHQKSDVLLMASGK